MKTRKLNQAQIWTSRSGKIVFSPTYEDGTQGGLRIRGCYFITQELADKIASAVFDELVRDRVRIYPFLGKAVGYTFYVREVED